MIELQNGCACCSLGEEFIQSIAQMMDKAAERGRPWDHIVVESSGVAEPREIRENFQRVMATTPEELNGARLDTLVTVVDSNNFLTEYEKRNRVNQRQDLGADDYSEGNTRQVVDLMVEQIECADVILLNKADRATPDTMALLKETIATLNPHAKMYTCINGIVPLTDVLAAAGGEGVAKLDEDGELKRLVNHLHSHGSEHGHAEKAADKPAEGHGHNHTGGTSDGGCTEGCTDESHEHGHHEHGHHEHGHHEHSHREGRETKRFGITSFCYERRRPFHPHRLMNVIRQLPVRQESLALSDALKDSPTPAASVSAAAGATASGTSAVADGGTDTSRSPMSTLIRAKGFIWLSNSHSQIFYWALAGKHFELSAYATWWAATAPEGWPQEPKENEEMQKDFSGEFGDRRQEIVFIGVGMDRLAIEKMLDECLLSDDEVAVYRQHWVNQADPAFR